MNFDLYTIDWTAIGSIVTFVAMLIAYWAIHMSDKQNKDNQRLQQLLIQREIEQKRLDELVENIMIINDAIQPIVVVDYSVKLIHGILSEDDRHFIEKMAEKDRSDNNRLNIQLIKYGKNHSAKNVLLALSQMRQKYGEWVRYISTLNLYKTHPEIPFSDLSKTISTMVKLSKEISPECDKYIHEALRTGKNDLDRAINLMNVFCYQISGYLIEGKKRFKKELYDFVQREQNRIDNIAFHNSAE